MITLATKAAHVAALAVILREAAQCAAADESDLVRAATVALAHLDDYLEWCHHHAYEEVETAPNTVPHLHAEALLGWYDDWRDRRDRVRDAAEQAATALGRDPGEKGTARLADAIGGAA